MNPVDHPHGGGNHQVSPFQRHCNDGGSAVGTEHKTDSASSTLVKLPRFRGTLPRVKRLVSSLPAELVCSVVPRRRRTKCDVGRATLRRMLTNKARWHGLLGFFKYRPSYKASTDDGAEPSLVVGRRQGLWCDKPHHIAANWLRINDGGECVAIAAKMIRFPKLLLPSHKHTALRKP